MDFDGDVSTTGALQPHPVDTGMGPLQVTTTVRVSGGMLFLEWNLVDPGGQVLVAEPAAAPEKRDGLWNETCFEAFLATKDLPCYWELNVSPAGHWNLFRFSAYRLPAGTACPVRSVTVRRRDTASGMELEAELPLSRLALSTAGLEVGPAAMLYTRDGRRGHWALHHPCDTPDFHLRDGFRMTLPDSRRAFLQDDAEL